MPGAAGKKGKGGKGHSKRKAPDELWNEGTPPERVNPLQPFLSDKLPRGYIQVLTTLYFLKGPAKNRIFGQNG